jgi:hypothetical protein
MKVVIKIQCTGLGARTSLPSPNTNASLDVNLCRVSPIFVPGESTLYWITDLLADHLPW